MHSDTYRCSGCPDLRSSLCFQRCARSAREVLNSELWCTDLCQSASVLEPGVCCLDHACCAAVAILERIAICFGTESTGVSTEMLEGSSRAAIGA